MSWQDQYQQSNVQVPDGGYAGPPRIYWRNGNPAVRTGGFFYTKATEHPDVLGAPWVESNRYPNDAGGYEVAQLAFAVIGWRAEPFLKTKTNGKTSYQFLPKYELGAQIYTEYLVMVDGLDYPCVLIVKGTIGKCAGEAVREFDRDVLNVAMRQQKKRVARWAFWMPMGGKTDRRGPVYEHFEEGGSITPLVLKLPDLAEEELLDTLFVGIDTLVRGAAIHEEYAAWFKEKRAGKTQEVASITPDGYAVSDEDDPTDHASNFGAAW